MLPAANRSAVEGARFEDLREGQRRRRRASSAPRAAKKFVTEAGVDGHFVLLCDSNNKCVSLERVAR